MTKELREKIKLSFYQAFKNVDEKDLPSIVEYIEQEILEAERRAIEETITYISKHQ